jgi:hypothetical protein
VPLSFRPCLLVVAHVVQQLQIVLQEPEIEARVVIKGGGHTHLEMICIYVCVLSGPVSTSRCSHTVVLCCTYTDGSCLYRALFPGKVQKALPLLLLIIRGTMLQAGIPDEVIGYFQFT